MPPRGRFNPASLSPREARAFGLALAWAAASMDWAGERYPEFAAWCAAQPCSPYVSEEQLEAAAALLRDAAQAAFTQADTEGQN